MVEAAAGPLGRDAGQAAAAQACGCCLCRGCACSPLCWRVLPSGGEGGPVSRADLLSGDGKRVEMSQGPGEIIELNAGAASERSC